MSLIVDWSGPASRDMRRLDATDRQRVYEAIHQFAATGIGDVKRLRGPNREWRLRVGDLRVRFTHPDTTTLRVLRVLPRDRAYR